MDRRQSRKIRGLPPRTPLLTITQIGRPMERRFTSLPHGMDTTAFWGLHIDPASHRPSEVFAVDHLHGRQSLGHGGWSAAAGQSH